MEKIAHDVREDGDRYERLTCHSPQCGEAAVVRQPHMGEGQWERARQDFLTEHPVALVVVGCE
ncbi:MAG: hypothetical protein AAB581_00560 [Patescibacteria group bacterium]